MFFVANEASEECAGVRGEHGRAPRLALDGHRLTTFRAVVVALVLRAVEAFVLNLRRGVGGCLISDGRALSRRFSWELARGPAGREVESVCGRRACVRPTHLAEVTP
jgi:hypothetical protein